jgi:pimeloyl-ACP methyl ester carboxylesterase
MTLLIGIITFAVLLVATLIVISHSKAAEWMRAPRAPGRMINSGDGQWYVTDKGHGQFTVLIESRLGGPSPEWWSIQDTLAQHARVVTYDRAGYGWSQASNKPRTSAQIASELRDLLHSANIPGPYVLVGHSQGGLYAQHFARLHPHEVAGCVFLDPLSPLNDRFEKELDPRVFRGSGVNKLPAMKLTEKLCKLGVLPMLKSLLLKSPPFFYYKNMLDDVVEILWRHHLRPSLYDTAIAEYTQAFLAANTQQLRERPFPNVPLAVIYHDATTIIDEIIQYGGLNREEALQVEKLWEQLTRTYLALSPDSKWVVADRSSHFIPLDQPDVVITTVTHMLTTLKTRALSA